MKYLLSRLRTFTLLVLFLSLYTKSTIAIKAYDTAFDVEKTPQAPGSCFQHLALLDQMFTEIQAINSNAVQQLSSNRYNRNAETQKLAQSIFGISPSNTGRFPTTGIDGQKIQKVQKWFSDVNVEISGTVSRGLNQPALYCDSTVFELKNPQDPFPLDPRKTCAQELGQQTFTRNWIYWILPQNGWLELPKTDYPRFPSYPNTNNPTYCAYQDTYAWTLEPDPGSDRHQAIIILCPSSFTKTTVYNQAIPNQLDTSAQAIGEVLDNMEPRSATWYHEIFHLVFPPEPNQSTGQDEEKSPDAKYRRARRAGGRPVPGFPSQKSAFLAGNTNTYGAVECMYLALYDDANPATTNINQVESTMNPESYTWFAIASYLSSVGVAHQDWSTGACRDQGANPSRVTVTRGTTIPKRTALPAER